METSPSHVFLFQRFLLLFPYRRSVAEEYHSGLAWELGRRWIGDETVGSLAYRPVTRRVDDGGWESGRPRFDYGRDEPERSE